jgi:hypothetical protein
MLIVFHTDSPVVGIVNAMKCGLLYAFADPVDIDALADEVANEWFMSGKMRESVEIDPASFLPYTAEGMTRALAACFDEALGRHRMKP